LEETVSIENLKNPGTQLHRRTLRQMVLDTIEDHLFENLGVYPIMKLLLNQI